MPLLRLFFIILSYVLLVTWLGMLMINLVVTTLYTLSWGVCSNTEVRAEDGQLDFYVLNFLFPPGSQRVNLLLEGPLEIDVFCREFVERAEVMFVLATISSLIVTLSLVHFLMALSANYAHIRGYDKFTDLKVSSKLYFIIEQLRTFCYQDLYTMDFSNTIVTNNRRNTKYTED